MAVKRWWKKAEDRPVWAVILEAALVKQYGLSADEEQEQEIVFRLSEKWFRIVRGNRKLRHLTQYQDIPL
jgi:hypothetical protein